MKLENKLTLGLGIYTIPDISQILRLPNQKINRWIKQFWDGKLGEEYNLKYSWIIDKTKAISFHTLVEIYSFYQLSSVGVRSTRILEAHKILSERFNTTFPFANSQLLENINTDGKRIFFNIGDERFLSLDGTGQFNLSFIKVFFRKLDFDNELLATRLWPLGKDKSILCDPTRKFGLPVIENKNIHPETIAGMYSSGDSIEFLAKTYNLTQNQVRHAIEFCQNAA